MTAEDDLSQGTRVLVKGSWEAHACPAACASSINTCWHHRNWSARILSTMHVDHVLDSVLRRPSQVRTAQGSSTFGPWQAGWSVGSLRTQRGNRLLVMGFHFQLKLCKAETRALVLDQLHCLSQLVRVIVCARGSTPAMPSRGSPRNAQSQSPTCSDLLSWLRMQHAKGESR